MNIEKIKILAYNLGLHEEINDLIHARRRVDGEFSFFKKSKARDKEKYQPEVDRLRNLISFSLQVLFPEWEGAEWSYGRLEHNVTYVTIFNPEWKKNVNE